MATGSLAEPGWLARADGAAGSLTCHNMGSLRLIRGNPRNPRSVRSDILAAGAKHYRIEAMW
jgi:hypothetical protein